MRPRDGCGWIAGLSQRGVGGTCGLQRPPQLARPWGRGAAAVQLNGYTRHMFPMKFSEYLSSGLPVVATEIPALEAHADVTLCPPVVEAFERAIAAALAGAGRA